ncbi:MAG: hypothetical protein KC657_02485 [Myxococcales bacterium]|nr:hypothetical protein [Myxococcales bacterium]
MTQPHDSSTPFTRDALVDKPGIHGARWWHQALEDRGAQVARRTAIRGMLLAAAAIAGFGTLLAVCANSLDTGPDAKEVRKTALQLQREFGWNFGAVGEALVFDGTRALPYKPASLVTLATDAAPKSAAHQPFYLRTLFEAPYARPTLIATLPAEEIQGFQPLFTALRPMVTPAMETAYLRAQGLAALFADKDAKVALVVDLPGPEAVAFAAGLAHAFDPVMLFDNWPHPRGVVRAHHTLAAAAYYQPLLASAGAERAPSAPPAFVLDRDRLATYIDDAKQFDNRYAAKLPPAAALKALGVLHVLYVVPTGAEARMEKDDINDDFLAYAAAGLEVRSLPANLFAPMHAGDETYAYGGSPDSQHAFFLDYPWAPPGGTATLRPGNLGKDYTPRARRTSFSTGTGATGNRPRPTGFGTVPIMVAVGTGAVLGARHSRSGSWNRSSGGWGGG